MKSIPEQHLVKTDLLANAKDPVKEDILDNNCLKDQKNIKNIAEIACFLGKWLTTLSTKRSTTGSESFQPCENASTRPKHTVANFLLPSKFLNKFRNIWLSQE